MKEILNTKSSKMLSDFLEKNSLHKRDFAQMVGVTLSYVYNLIDNTIPFSTRSTTLERIATVMNVEPEVFEEYRLPQEPIIIDETVEKVKQVIKSRKMNIVDFLKAFPRKKRLDIVDMLRGTLPLPLDYNEIKYIGEVLNLKQNEIFDIWEARFRQVLDINGMNIYSNSDMINKMIDCAKKYVIAI